MTGLSAAANKPDLSEAEWALSRRTSVEISVPPWFAHHVHNPFQEGEQGVPNRRMEQRGGRPNGRLSGSETNQSKCTDAMRWTDKPESARLRLHSSQPNQWEASDTDGKAQG